MVGLIISGFLFGCGSHGSKSQIDTTNVKTEANLRLQSNYNQAHKFMLKGRVSAAIKVLERMTVDHPKLSGPYANLGILYQKKNRLEDAEKVLRRAVGLNSNSAMVHNQLGIVYRKTGKFIAARRQYEKAIKLDPNYPLAHLNLGILYDLYLGDMARALMNYHSYQKLTPKKDRKVSQWIVDLERRIKRSNKNVSQRQ